MGVFVKPMFLVQAFEERDGQLTEGEAYSYPDEVRAARRGRAMAHRVSGVAFFKIETSEQGDVWTEIEVLATHGMVPPEVE